VTTRAASVRVGSGRSEARLVVVAYVDTGVLVKGLRHSGATCRRRSEAPQERPTGIIDIGACGDHVGCCAKGSRKRTHSQSPQACQRIDRDYQRLLKVRLNQEVLRDAEKLPFEFALHMSDAVHFEVGSATLASAGNHAPASCRGQHDAACRPGGKNGS